MLRSCKQIGLKISFCDGRNTSPINIILTQRKMRIQFSKESFLIYVFEYVCCKKMFYTRSLLLNRKEAIEFVSHVRYVKEVASKKNKLSCLLHILLIKLCVYCIYNL